MSLPTVSVIIPVYNGAQYIGACLESVFNQTLPGKDYEVIVVDNNSTDDGMDIARDYHVQIVSETKTGSYAARNAGIKRAKSGILAFLDVDCAAAENWLEAAVDYLANNQSVGLLSGNVIFKPGGEMLTVWGYFDLFSFLRQEYLAGKGCSLTANLFVRREVLDAYGCFNDDLISGGDTEWTKKVTDAGISLSFENSVRVYHPVRNNFKQVAAKCKRVGFGMGQIAKIKKSGLSLFRPTHFKVPVTSFYRIALKEAHKLSKLKLLLKMLVAASVLQCYFFYGKAQGFLYEERGRRCD